MTSGIESCREWQLQVDWAILEEVYATIDVDATVISKRCSFDHRIIRWLFKRKFPYLYIENKPISAWFYEYLRFLLLRYWSNSFQSFNLNGSIAFY